MSGCTRSLPAHPVTQPPMEVEEGQGTLAAKPGAVDTL